MKPATITPSSCCCIGQSQFCKPQLAGPGVRTLRQKASQEQGATIIEVMIAVALFLIIMVGGMNFFALPRGELARQKQQRLAVIIAAERLERLKALGYDELTKAYSETATAVTLGALTAQRTTTITEIDDAADGLAGSDSDAETTDYKQVDIEVAWTSTRRRQIALSTRISKILYGSVVANQSSGWGRTWGFAMQAEKGPGYLTNSHIFLTDSPRTFLIERTHQTP